MTVNHLIPAVDMALPEGTPVLTACGKVRPRRDRHEGARTCRKCGANVAALGGRIVDEPSGTPSHTDRSTT